MMRITSNPRRQHSRRGDAERALEIFSPLPPGSFLRGRDRGQRLHRQGAGMTIAEW
jgi:hypothetical protein